MMAVDFVSGQGRTNIYVVFLELCRICGIIGLRVRLNTKQRWMPYNLKLWGLRAQYQGAQPKNRPGNVPIQAIEGTTVSAVIPCYPAHLSDARDIHPLYFTLSNLISNTTDVIICNSSFINDRTGPLSQLIVGTTSILLFSTGVVLCDNSPRTSSTTTATSESSRQHTEEDKLSAHQKHQKQKSQQLESEKGALFRLKSGFQDLQTKFSEFDTSNISTEIFRIPPHFLEWVEKIRADVSFSEGSVSDEIWKEAQDPVKNPELEKDARVWIGNRICQEELEFYSKRREFTRSGLAKYLGVDVNEIDERDIPIIAIAGSGGGYRAMLGTTGYFKAMKNAGLFDCVTYMAGILFTG